MIAANAGKEWKLPEALGGHRAKPLTPVPGMPGWYAVRIPGMRHDIMVQGECLVITTPPEPVAWSLVACSRRDAYPSYFLRLGEPGTWVGVGNDFQRGRSWAWLHQEFDEVIALVDAGSSGLPFSTRSQFGRELGLAEDDADDYRLTFDDDDAIFTKAKGLAMACAILSDQLGRPRA